MKDSSPLSRRTLKSRTTQATPVAPSTFGALGLIMEPEEGPSSIPQILFQSILTEASRQHLHLSVANLVDDRLIDKISRGPILKSLCADGLLVYYPMGRPKGLAAHVEKYKSPCVWLNIPHETDSVRPDDLHAAYEATRSLLAMGHRRIALVIPDHTFKGYNVQYRQLGYTNALREANAVAEIHLCPGVVPHPHWRDEAMRWLKGKERPTAVLCFSPEIAFELASVARELRMHIPRDLSLVAFHDVALNLFGVRLSTIKIPYERVGQSAVRLLMEKIHRSSRVAVVDKEEKIPFEWNEGATVAPPRARLKNRVKAKSFVE